MISPPVAMIAWALLSSRSDSYQAPTPMAFTLTVGSASVRCGISTTVSRVVLTEEARKRLEATGDIKEGKLLGASIAGVEFGELPLATPLAARAGVPPRETVDSEFRLGDLPDPAAENLDGYLGLEALSKVLVMVDGTTGAATIHPLDSLNSLLAREFRPFRGYERMKLERTPVPVVPVRLGFRRARIQLGFWNESLYLYPEVVRMAGLRTADGFGVEAPVEMGNVPRTSILYAPTPRPIDRTGSEGLAAIDGRMGINTLLARKTLIHLKENDVYVDRQGDAERLAIFLTYLTGLPLGIGTEGSTLELLQAGLIAHWQSVPEDKRGRKVLSLAGIESAKLVDLLRRGGASAAAVIRDLNLRIGAPGGYSVILESSEGPEELRIAPSKDRLQPIRGSSSPSLF